MKKKQPEKILIEIITHFDIMDFDCNSDYDGVEVKIDKKKWEWGDYYHEKGNIRAEEFINGYIAGSGLRKSAFKIIKTNIADSNINGYDDWEIEEYRKEFLKNSKEIAWDVGKNNL